MIGLNSCANGFNFDFGASELLETFSISSLFALDNSVDSVAPSLLLFSSTVWFWLSTVTAIFWLLVDEILPVSVLDVTFESFLASPVFTFLTSFVSVNWSNLIPSPPLVISMGSWVFWLVIGAGGEGNIGGVDDWGGCVDHFKTFL